MEPREVADRYTTIAEGLNARVAGCAATDWAASTPCPEWTVRDILEHVVGVHRVALALLDEAAAEPDAGEDAAGAWTTVTTAMRQAVRDPERATRIVSPRFGDMPFEELVSRMVCSGHSGPRLGPGPGHRSGRAPRRTRGGGGVDLDAAGGRDPARVRALFGPAVEPPDGADTQTKLLCFLGRTV